MKNGKKSTRVYRRYDKSFKEEAVNLLKQGRRVQELSDSLGVSTGLLYRWKSIDTGSSKRTNEEVKELKRKNRQLQEENDILKKALSIFSQSG